MKKPPARETRRVLHVLQLAQLSHDAAVVCEDTASRLHTCGRFGLYRAVCTNVLIVCRGAFPGVPGRSRLIRARTRTKDRRWETKRDCCSKYVEFASINRKGRNSCIIMNRVRPYATLSRASMNIRTDARLFCGSSRLRGRVVSLEAL